MPPKAETRLHVDAALRAGERVTLGAAAAHRLRAVLRLQPGDAVSLFNARDGEWLARVAELTRGAAAVELLSCLRQPRDEGDLWLVFAVVKRARLELLVEKATELGASTLLPVTTERTQPHQPNRDRLALIAREAAEQSERLTVPDIRPVQPLVKLLAEWVPERRLVLCDESGLAPPAAAVLPALASKPLAVLVGPEGGLAETELDGLRELPFVFPVGLGPRVLRSETAALAALAVVQALAGDWRKARREERARPAGSGD